MTTAQLGFAIDSSQAAEASSDLDRLTASSAKAEQAANKVSLAATKASQSFGDISPALDRIIAGIDQLNQTSSSISNRLDAMSRAATGAARSAKGIGDAANNAGKGVDTLSEKIRKAGDSSRSFGDQAAHVQAFRDNIDRLTAKFTPLQTAAQKYATAVSDIQTAHRLNIISAQQMTAELDKERAAFERLNVAASKTPGRGPTAANSNELSEGNRRFIGRDIGFQLQDIAVTAAGGMSPKMIALQQGTQIAGAVQGLTLKQTGSALAGAFAGVLNPVALASIAITGLSAAAIQFFMNGTDKAKSLDDVLKRSAETLDRLKDSYGDLAKTSASITSVAGSDFVLSDARTQQIALNAAAEKEKKNFLGSITDTSFGSSFLGADSAKSLQRLLNPQGDMKLFAGPIKSLLDTEKDGRGGIKTFNDQVEGLYATLLKTSDDPQGLRSAADSVKSIADAAFSATGKFKPFEDAMNRLRIGGDLSAFVAQVHQIGKEKGISKLADELLGMGDDAVKATQQAETLRRTLRAIDREDSRPGMRDRDSLQAYVARRAASTSQINNQFQADLRMQSARTFADRLSAVQARSLAQRPANMDEAGGPSARASRDVTTELARQWNELGDAARNRQTAMTAAIETSRQDIDLVGKSAGQQAALRKEYELTAQIRAEADKNGLGNSFLFDVFYGRQIATIHKLSQEYGNLADQMAKTQLANNLAFQRDQFGRSAEGRQIADQQRGAGLPVDLLSKQAFEIYSTNRLQIDQDKGIAQDQFDAQLKGLRARTAAERVAAARAAADAQNQKEPPDIRKQRVDNAGALMQAQIDKERDTATRERSRSLDRMLTSQREELSLVGQTGGAAEGLRKQYELIAALQDEAAKNGGIVSAAEVARIKEATASYGAMVDKINLARLNDDLDFQSRQLRRTPEQQQIAGTLRQSGLPEDFNTPIARRIKQQEQQRAEKEQIDQFSNNLASNIVQSGGKIGKAFGETFLSSLQDVAQKQLSKLFNQLLTSVLMPNAGAGATVQTAANGAISLGAQSVSRLTSPTSIASQPMSFPTTDVASYITQAAIKRGIDPSTALAVAKSEGGLTSWNQQSGVLKNGIQEPSFGPYQLYMGGGLGNAFQKQTGMNPANAASGPAGVDFALDYASKNGWGSWYGAKNTGIGNWQGIGSGSAKDAAQALDKLTGSVGSATQGLGTLGNGLGQLGQSLSSNIFPAAPQASGGGGIFGLLGNLFSSPFKAAGPQGAAALAGTLKPGLFASGTNYSPAGPAIVGENGPELLNLPQGSQVTSNHKLLSALSANSNQPQQNRQLNVTIQGASGDDHVRSLVQQGVGAALSEYNTQQRRGGFGVMQARYGNQKA